jgi:hypothetical protein
LRYCREEIRFLVRMADPRVNGPGAMAILAHADRLAEALEAVAGRLGERK